MSISGNHPGLSMTTQKSGAAWTCRSISRKSRSNNIHYDPNATSTGFTAGLENQATRFGMDVYVENVINRWLPEWLEERGYAQVGNPNLPNFYRAADPQPPAVNREKSRPGSNPEEPETPRP